MTNEQAELAAAKAHTVWVEDDATCFQDDHVTLEKAMKMYNVPPRNTGQEWDCGESTLHRIPDLGGVWWVRSSYPGNSHIKREKSEVALAVEKGFNS